MRDSIIKNTGNSRYLKSAISAATTWEQFRAALIAGTLPIDLNGINSAGWQQVGDALNKANLLSDATVSALNDFLTSALPANPKVTDALKSLATVGLCKIATGNYTGTDVFGVGNENSLTFDFSPLLVAVAGGYKPTGVGTTHSECGILLRGVYGVTLTQSPNYACKLLNATWSFSNGKVTWWAESARDQLNDSRITYRYVAIG